MLFRQQVVFCAMTLSCLGEETLLLQDLILEHVYTCLNSISTIHMISNPLGPPVAGSQSTLAYPSSRKFAIFSFKQ